MATRKPDAAPLIAEAHPLNYDGLPFIALIQYRKNALLTITDNCDEDSIRAYVLDFCSPQRISEEAVLEVAQYWYDNHRDDHPLSVEFSRQGLTKDVSPIYRAFNVDLVSRIVGPLYFFPLLPSSTPKRRRRKPSAELDFKSIETFGLTKKFASD